VLEKPPLAIEPAAISNERSRGSDDPVAGHHDGNRIGAVGRADRADGRGRADGAGNVQVRGGAPRADRPQGGPHPALKIGAVEFDLQPVERRQITGEIVVERGRGAGGIAVLDDRRGRLLAVEKPLGMLALVAEAHHHEQVGPRGEGQRTDWRLSHRQSEHGREPIAVRTPSQLSSQRGTSGSRLRLDPNRERASPRTRGTRYLTVILDSMTCPALSRAVMRCCPARSGHSSADSELLTPTRTPSTVHSTVVGAGATTRRDSV